MTTFTIQAPSWEDDDGQISYRFQYKPPNGTDTFIAISATQNYSSLETILSSMGQDTEVALRVFAIDYYLANTTAETTVFLNTSLSGNVTENIDVV